MTTTSELLLPQTKLIERAIERDRPVFELNQPAKVTVKQRNGQYRKEALIGEEQFECSSLYQGKRGDLIFVFKPIYGADYSFMEMKVDEAKAKLHGFTAFVEGVLGMDIEEELMTINKRIKEEEERAIFEKKAAVYGENQLFGSWG